MRRLLLSLPIALMTLMAFVSPFAAHADNSISADQYLQKLEPVIAAGGALFQVTLAADNVTLPAGLTLSKGIPFIAPTEVNKGDPVTIKVRATNDTTEQISYSFSVKVNGKYAGSAQLITLDASTSKDVVFQINAEDSGNNEVAVGNLQGSFTVKGGSLFDMFPPYLWGFFGIVLGVIIMMIVLMVTKPAKKRGAQGTDLLKKQGKQKGKTGKAGAEGQMRMPGPMQRPGMASMPDGMFMSMQEPGQQGGQQDMSMPGMQQPFQPQGPGGMQQPFQPQGPGGMQPFQPGMQQPGRGPQYPPQPSMPHGGPQGPMSGMQPGMTPQMGMGQQPQMPNIQGGQPGMPFGMQRQQPQMPPGMQAPPPPGMPSPMQAPGQPMMPGQVQPLMPPGMHAPMQPGMPPPMSGAGPSMSMPKFSVSNLIISPNKVKVLEPINISIMVSNNGVQTSKYSVVLRVGGVVENISDMTLPPGASQTASFTVVKDVAGDYYADIDGMGGFFTVIPLAPPSFIVSNFSLGPERVRQGQAVTVTASVTNVGEIMGTHTLILRVKGVSDSQQDVTLGPNKTENVEFQIAKDTPGFYPVALENWTGKFVVEMDWTG